MRTADVVDGAVYAVKVGARLAPVRLGRRYPYSAAGWYGRNLATGREVVVRSAQRLRYRVERCGCGQWARDLAAHVARRHPDGGGA